MSVLKKRFKLFLQVISFSGELFYLEKTKDDVDGVLKSILKVKDTYKYDVLKIMKRHLLTLVLITLFSSNSYAGLKIYYMRHAEGGHNVKADWEKKGIPKSEWPAYVGNPDMFTPKGEKEQKESVAKLQQYEFDFIASSPIWRARNTVIPYLKATGQKAEVWPELKEGTGMTLILSEDLPAVKEDILNKGKPIHIPKAERPYMERREGGKREYQRYPSGSSDEVKTAYMKYVTQHAISMIKERFGGSDKSILLVGHNSAGVSLLKLLLEKAPGGAARSGIHNTGIWMVEEEEDGSFKLKMYNDKEFSEE